MNITSCDELAAAVIGGSGIAQRLASMPTSLTYSDNEVANYGYDASSAWLSSLSATPAGGSATTLLDSIAYSGAGGAAGHPTSASIGNGVYSFSADYDANTRLTSLSLTNVSSGSLVFRSQRGYDTGSNVTAVNTTLAAGTDNQGFCYDAQNRLTWAGSSGKGSGMGTCALRLAIRTRCRQASGMRAGQATFSRLFSCAY